MSGLD